MEPNMYQFVKRLITILVRYGIILKYNVIDQSGLQLNNMYNRLDIQISVLFLPLLIPFDQLSHHSCVTRFRPYL